MNGAYAVFTVTNYWEKMDMQLEIQQGKNLADAAKQNGVEHYIWSSLLNVKKRTFIFQYARTLGNSSHNVTLVC